MPSSSIGGISSGSGRRIAGVTSDLGFLIDRSFSGAASKSVLLKGTLFPYEGSGKSAKLSLGRSLAIRFSFGEDSPGLMLENVVNRADCGIDDVVGAEDDVGCEFAPKGVFLVGESVVNIGGFGAVIGTKPNLPWPECEVPISREVFVGDGL